MGRKCPICDLVKENNALTGEVAKLEGAKSELESQIDSLESELSNAKAINHWRGQQ